ncbi:MAG: 4Fe-4S dicluster domain-containing protein [Euryarchaeota archaeon]|nr:4Fe-4S dicluster domain-containing protein [Euryarchaeota archaeon]
MIVEDTGSKMLEIMGMGTTLCYQCGECTVSCPVGEFTGEKISVRSIIRAAQIGQEYYDNIWACATCKLCENYCPRNVDIVNIILAVRTMAFSKRKAPEKIEKVIWDIFENGNPWGGKKKERAKWAEGMEIKDASEGVDVLLYVGCEAAYDPKQHGNVRSIAEILRRAGVNFGILGNNERCCGEPLKNAGEIEYLEELVSQNIDQFEGTGAKIIVTVSPHCSKMFKEVYRKAGLKIEVMHYTEYLNRLYSEGLIKFKGGNSENVTYHDPCLLSRGEGLIEEPRDLLKASGFKIVEMKDYGKNSICCGGGGNRMFLEFKGKRLADVRTDQAIETGTGIIVTACPYCNMNLHDSVKTRAINIKVMELAELLKERIE